MALLVAGALVVTVDLYLVELAVAVDHRAVLAAEADHVSGVGGLGGGLAVHAGAVVGLRRDVAVGVEHLDGAAGVLGALSGQQATIGQRHGDAVVRGVGRGLFEDVELALAQCCGVDERDRASAVGEQGGAVAVRDHVPGVRGRDGEVGESGGLDVVVEVVAVALGEQAGVVHGDRVGGADRDVAAVAGGVQAEVALQLSSAEGGAVGRVERGDSALVGKHDPRGESADLGAVRGRGVRAVCARAASVGRAGAGAACGEGKGAEAEKSGRAPLHENCSHQVHARKLSADENLSHLDMRALHHICEGSRPRPCDDRARRGSVTAETAAEAAATAVAATATATAAAAAAAAAATTVVGGGGRRCPRRAAGEVSWQYRQLTSPAARTRHALCAAHQAVGAGDLPATSPAAQRTPPPAPRGVRTAALSARGGAALRSRRRRSSRRRPCGSRRHWRRGRSRPAGRTPRRSQGRWRGCPS